MVSARTGVHGLGGVSNDRTEVAGGNSIGASSSSSKDPVPTPVD
jgi:hypothetical protein